jgi:hypothetical protein
MKVKEFLRYTDQKIKLTALLFVSFFIMAYIQNTLGSYFTPAYFEAISDISASVKFQSSDALSYLAATFASLAAFSYLLSCLVVSMFAKKGRK